MNILIVASHPDDEVLGCGATSAKLACLGSEIHPFILGQGAMSRGEKCAQKNKDLKQAARQVAATLGTKPPIFLDLPDNRFDSLDLLDIVQPIEQIIHEIQPVMILTHHANDLNIDHQKTFQAVLTAARPMQNSTVQEILCFETPSSTEWGFGKIGSQFNPSVFYDVTNHFDQKIKALKYYEMEMREFSHPRSYKAIKVMAEKWGSVIGYSMCEAFEVVYARR